MKHWVNLYAGLGGNRKKWKNVKVTAVENDPKIADVYKRLHPQDHVVIADAHQYLLDHFEEFDGVWSSPPCQRNSRQGRSGRNKKPRYPDLRVYEEIIFLHTHFKGLWVVENVIPYYKPLLPATQIGRHLFWSNFLITNFKVPQFPGFIGKQTVAAKKQLQDWLGIHYEETIYYGKNHCPTQILRNCIHPDLGLHIMNCAINKPRDLFS